MLYEVITVLYNSLAFVVPKRFFLEDEGFYTSIFYHLNNFCQNENQSLALYVVNSANENDGILPAALTSSGCDGIFIAGEMKSEYIHSLSTLGIPMILIDFYKPRITSYNVCYTKLLRNTRMEEKQPPSDIFLFLFIVLHTDELTNIH